MIAIEKWIILTPLQKLPNNVGNLNGCPKCKKLPNLVTLFPTDKCKGSGYVRYAVQISSNHFYTFFHQPIMADWKDIIINTFPIVAPFLFTNWVLIEGIIR